MNWISHRYWMAWLALALAAMAVGGCKTPESGSLSSQTLQPAKVRASQIIGTQAIGGPYQFTDEPYLLEVARVLEGMGSNILKFTAGPRYTRRPYHLEQEPGVTSLTTLLDRHPVYREVLSMGFRDYFFWASPFGNVRWTDGLDTREAETLYAEFRELAEYLLTTFNGTGKRFYLGHWEGDWLLLPSKNPDDDPSPERIRGMAQYLAVRQRAIDDARNSVPHDDVAIYHYTEVNLVMKGINDDRPTLTNAVLPNVDVDYVSYSSYDTIQDDGMQENVRRALDHIESKMIPRPDWKGKRVFVGEFAIRASLAGFDRQEHDRRNREVIKACLDWGCPFILYWQVYCNEPKPEMELGYNGFWLIDPAGEKYPLYDTFQNYWQAAAEYARQHEAESGQVPTDAEMRKFAIRHF
jgi:hypothetical protein